MVYYHSINIEILSTKILLFQGKVIFRWTLKSLLQHITIPFLIFTIDLGRMDNFTLEKVVILSIKL